MEMVMECPHAEQYQWLGLCAETCPVRQRLQAEANQGSGTEYSEEVAAVDPSVRICLIAGQQCRCPVEYILEAPVVRIVDSDYVQTRRIL